RLLRVYIPGYSIHIDGHFLMLDKDHALVDIQHLPYVFLSELAALGIDIIPVDERERLACNALVLSPGRMLMPAGFPRTVDNLSRKGYSVKQIQYAEAMKNGGSIHCSTMELVRDW